MLKCCNNDVKYGELWFLKDIKDFTARKLYKARCPVCGDDVVLLIEKRIADGKVFANNINHIEAVKTLYRENKRKLTVIPDIKYDSLYGWIYGVNVGIKNKNGEVTQVRQYASDFRGKKILTKKLNIKAMNDE